jgi:hypothetical protein
LQARPHAAQLESRLDGQAVYLGGGGDDCFAVYAEQAGKVAEVLVPPGTQVEGGDLLLRFEG